MSELQARDYREDVGGNFRMTDDAAQMLIDIVELSAVMALFAGLLVLGIWSKGKHMPGTLGERFIRLFSRERRDEYLPPKRKE